MKRKRWLIVGNFLSLFFFFGSPLFGSPQPPPWATQLYSTSDILYSKYRQGMIKRHIASNGRYYAFIWLRNKDAVDLGLINKWPGADLVPNVNDNSRDPIEAPLITPWVPVIFYERLPRTIPAEYIEKRVVGYIATEPGPDRIPLYEWVHNTEREIPGNDFIDHYYSTDPKSLVARCRYRRNGIIGYILKDAAPGFAPLFVGFHPEERNHILTTNKTNPLGLKNFRYIGYIKESHSSTYHAKLKEFRREGFPKFYTDNMYSAEYIEYIEKIIALQPFPHTLLKKRSHFLARQVIAGGDDNPLYEGGLALATFSLEHIHGVSPHSLEYAKLLFDFIEESEEQSFPVLKDGLNSRTGYLRRVKNSWQSASTWGASTDELVGVLLGLKYFIRATEGVDPDYARRARLLMMSIDSYLANRDWIYIDSRIMPSLENYIAEASREDNSIIGRAVGTLVFQYPFARVIKENLGYSSSNPESFNRTVEVAKELCEKFGVHDYLVSFGLFIYPVAACIGEIVTYFTDYRDFVLGCGRNIDTHSEVYELLIQNAYPLAQYKGFPSEGFYNHTMLLYTGWMVLDSGVVGSDRKKTFANRFIRYIYDMWGRGPAMSGGVDIGYIGQARENLLFAIIAKKCFQLLNYDEIIDALDLPGRHRDMVVSKLENEIDRVINKYTRDVVGTWQPDLPLGEPKWYSMNTPKRYPWESTWTLPLGIGCNHAWRYADMNFRIWTRTSGVRPDEIFQSLGPWYQDANGNWSVGKTLSNLRKFARVGFQGGDPEYDQLDATRGGLYMKIEAGGNDFMFMRMLLAELGMNPPKLPDRDTKYKVLPVDGASPW